MRTLIVSDLHLGSLSGADLLRRAELRAPLLEAIADVERLVLLGDVLELRHGPMREAMAAARPFFEDVGRALAVRS
jgi:metallophosphoesterase superfamily enzyme